MFPEQTPESIRARELALDFMKKINDAVLYPLIMLLMAVALLWFLYGAFKYIRKSDSPGERETGRKHMIYGIIGLLVMTTALGILTIAANTFGLPDPDRALR